MDLKSPIFCHVIYRRPVIGLNVLRMSRGDCNMKYPDVCVGGLQMDLFCLKDTYTKKARTHIERISFIPILRRDISVK